MSDSNITTHNGETITVTNTFTVAQAINEIRTLSRQTALATRQAEELAALKDRIQDKAEEIYDFSFMATTNLERIAALAEQLDEMDLTAKGGKV